MDTSQVRVKRRRRFTREQKQRIVEETFAEGISVSQVARRHAVNSNQLFNWRRDYRCGLLGGDRLVPVQVAEPAVPTLAVSERSPDRCVVVELASGHRVHFASPVDHDALRTVLAALR